MLCISFLKWNGYISLHVYISLPCKRHNWLTTKHNKNKMHKTQTKCTNTMQLMQAHNATSTTACWAITKTNKQTHAKEKQKKTRACVNGNITTRFFFFFCYKWYTSKHTGRTIQWLKQIKKKTKTKTISVQACFIRVRAQSRHYISDFRDKKPRDFSLRG